MKKILLACSLFAFTATTVMAQNTTAAANAQTEAPKFKKINFISKANEIDATLTRKRPDLAQKSYGDMSNIMMYFMGQNMNALNNSSANADKATLQKTVEQQKKLYSEIKLLSTDMAKNKEQLAAKFKDFAATIPE